MDYVRQGDYERVSQSLSNYQQLRAAIEEICEIAVQQVLSDMMQVALGSGHVELQNVRHLSVP